MPDGATLINRFVLAIDVKQFSRRDTRRQADIQADLVPLLRNAARLALPALDPDPSRWDTQLTGGGLLLVLPADVDGVALVGRLPREINTLLAIRNSDRVPEARLRVRAAVHHDALLPSATWYAGPALIEVSRLLDAQPLRDALDHADPAHLALPVRPPRAAEP
jgi:hypothetical protein